MQCNNQNIFFSYAFKENINFREPMQVRKILNFWMNGL
ncbi:hypothetical protein XENTR_v10018933 [Xenopus tropicalis]|nr:hypothetical protein XENTR_v10018933 [Xenopus tropicalis]